MIKIGIVGLGRLGKIHIDHLSNLDEFQLVGLYDIQDQLAAQVGRDLQVRAFEHYEEMLEHCGAVLIATPTSSHYEYAVKAIRRGRHVFIEKPITVKTENARKLMKLAEEAGVLIQVGHVERFNPAFCAIKNRELNPRFIESHRLSQFDVRGTDVSVVLDLMIHDIDIVLSIVKAGIKRIHASGVAVITDNIDIANARLEFDNGTVANLTASRISVKKMRKMRLFQNNEYLGIDFLAQKVDIFRLTEHGEEGGIPILEADPEKKIIMEMPEISKTNAIKEELKAFAHSILTGKEPEVNAEQATKALELATQILYKIKKTSSITE